MKLWTAILYEIITTFTLYLCAYVKAMTVKQALFYDPIKYSAKVVLLEGWALVGFGCMETGSKRPQKKWVERTNGLS